MQGWKQQKEGGEEQKRKPHDEAELRGTDIRLTNTWLYTQIWSYANSRFDNNIKILGRILIIFIQGQLIAHLVTANLFYNFTQNMKLLIENKIYP